MTEESITLRFNLEDDVDRRVYAALQQLPDFYREPDLSRAVIRFIDQLVSAVGECEERTAQCQSLLAGLLSGKGAAGTAWQ